MKLTRYNKGTSKSVVSIAMYAGKYWCNCDQVDYANCSIAGKTPVKGLCSSVEGLHDTVISSRSLTGICNAPCHRAILTRTWADVTGGRTLISTPLPLLTCSPNWKHLDVHVQNLKVWLPPGSFPWRRQGNLVTHFLNFTSGMFSLHTSFRQNCWMFFLEIKLTGWHKQSPKKLWNTINYKNSQQPQRHIPTISLPLLEIHHFADNGLTFTACVLYVPAS